MGCCETDVVLGEERSGAEWILAVEALASRQMISERRSDSDAKM